MKRPSSDLEMAEVTYNAWRNGLSCNARPWEELGEGQAPWLKAVQHARATARPITNDDKWLEATLEFYAALRGKLGHWNDLQPIQRRAYGVACKVCVGLALAAKRSASVADEIL